MNPFEKVIGTVAAQPGWVARATFDDGQKFDYPLVAWVTIERVFSGDPKPEYDYDAVIVIEDGFLARYAEKHHYTDPKAAWELVNTHAEQDGFIA